MRRTEARTKYVWNLSAKCAVNINQIQSSSTEMFLKMILVFEGKKKILVSFDFRKLKKCRGRPLNLTYCRTKFLWDKKKKISQLLLSDLEKRKTPRGKSWEYLFQKHNQLRLFFSEHFPGHTTKHWKIVRPSFPIRYQTASWWWLVFFLIVKIPFSSKFKK